MKALLVVDNFFENIYNPLLRNLDDIANCMNYIKLG